MLLPFYLVYFKKLSLEELRISVQLDMEHIQFVIVDKVKDKSIIVLVVMGKE
jgi:hypothetical protein